MSLVLTTLLPAALTGQTPPLFHSSISLVHIDAGAVDANGRIIESLSAADFRVFDDDQQQPIAAFAFEQEPLDLILLFDVSGSMRSAVRQVAAAGQRTFFELREADRVQIMTFTSEARVITPFTNDRGELAAVLNHLADLPFRGRTRIQDAANDAAMQFIRMDNHAGRRRAVLIVTDDLSPPAHSETRVVENFWEADAILSGIVIPHKALATLLHDRRGIIDRVISETGSDVIHPVDLDTALAEMMRRIRTRYSLYYRLPDGQPGMLRKVHVELSASALTRYPGARLSLREAYRLRLSDAQAFAKH